MNDQLPPHSVESEMCLLAALMLDSDFAREQVPTLSPDSFFLGDHKAIYACIRSLTLAGRPIDAVILRDELKRVGDLERVGGAACIAQILSTIPSAAHGPEYAKRVRELAALRAIIAVAENVARRAYSQQVDAANLSADLADAAAGIMANRSGSQIVSFENAVITAYDGLDEQNVELIGTGLADVDAAIGGIGPGETCIVAGRPSMGKSTFARTIATNVAKRGIPVGLISLEESAPKIARNAMAGAAMVDNHRIRAGNMDPEEWKRVADAVCKLQKLPIYICRTARSVDEIRAIATTMKQKHGCRMIIIDHLSRVRAPGKSLYEQTTNASGSISDLIKDLAIAGLVLCQLNRGVENRDDPRPTMSDLRDSGAIEQDADGILLLHRDDYYNVGSVGYQKSGIAEVIVAKWRDGVRGTTVRIRSELQYQRFIDLEKDLQDTYTGGRA